MVWIGADGFKQPQIGFRCEGCKRREFSPQAGSHIFGAPSEGALAGSAAPRWQTPTTPGRHIAGRQQSLPQDATLEDEGRAPLACIRRANFDDAHEETARSMWSPIDNCMFKSTQST